MDATTPVNQSAQVAETAYPELPEPDSDLWNHIHNYDEATGSQEIAMAVEQVDAAIKSYARKAIDIDRAARLAPVVAEPVAMSRLTVEQIDAIGMKVITESGSTLLTTVVPYGLEIQPVLRAFARAIAAAQPSPTLPEAQPIAWFRIENGYRVYYETNCWPDLTPLYSAAPLLPAPEGVSELEDMRVRKDAVYLERNQVVAALAKCFPSGVGKTAIEGWSEDWHGCVYIDLPTGQASWHFHDSQAYLFEGLPAYAGTWDGHDTPEKYLRLAALATPQPAQPAAAQTATPKPAMHITYASGAQQTFYTLDQLRAAMHAPPVSQQSEHGGQVAALGNIEDDAKHWFTSLDKNIELRGAAPLTNSESHIARMAYEAGWRSGHKTTLAALKPVQLQVAQPDNRTHVDSGALTMALNVLKRAGKFEVADELEKSASRLATPAPATPPEKTGGGK